MCEILSETVIPISEAPKHIPGRPHSATIWRWWQKGVRGIKLETFVCGGRRFTSTEAIARFIRGTTAAQNGPVTESILSRERRAEIKAAEQELAEAGI
ncbi:DUF1580 domain-containing protein [Planctomycetota bacterium]